MKFVIKGALYQQGDTVLRPHFTGDFFMVDCTEYLTKEEIKGKYSREFAKELTGEDGSYITVDEVKYFQAEYGPYNTDGMELLSDLSELEYYDEESDF